jgi:serine protease Do
MEDANSDATQPSSALGLKFVPLTSAMRPSLHIDKDVKGVVVTDVADDSPLAALGLQRGGVIEAINQQATPTPKDVSDKLSEAKHSKGAARVLILFNRAGVNQYAALPLNDQDKG